MDKLVANFASRVPPFELGTTRFTGRFSSAPADAAYRSLRFKQHLTLVQVVVLVTLGAVVALTLDNELRGTRQTAGVFAAIVVLCRAPVAGA